MKTELEVLIQHGENACGVDWNKARKEHAALVAVAEAAGRYAAACNDWNLATLENAIAALAAARNQ